MLIFKIIKIPLLLCFVILVCSCNENAMQDTGNTKLAENPKPQPYFGDSLITVSFLYKSDTTYKDALEKGVFSEMFTIAYSGDTAIIEVHRDLVAGIYNGACEIRNDTLNLNYWLDSSNCTSVIEHVLIICKAKAKGFTIDDTKVNFINTKSPIRKACE